METSDQTFNSLQIQQPIAAEFLSRRWARTNALQLEAIEISEQVKSDFERKILS